MDRTKKGLTGALLGMAVVIALLVGLVLGRTGRTEPNNVAPERATIVATLPAATIAPAAPDASTSDASTSASAPTDRSEASVSAADATTGAQLESGDSTAINSVHAVSGSDGEDLQAPDVGGTNTVPRTSDQGCNCVPRQTISPQPTHPVPDVPEVPEIQP